MDELAEELSDAIDEVTAYLAELGFNLELLLTASPVERLSLITDAINVICLNETSRAKFEAMARNVFKKYKALFPEEQARIKEMKEKFNRWLELE